jgi:hypothetical protein
MIELKPRRQNVQIRRPSRIRRDPVPVATSAERPRKASFWDTSEWETWTVVTGVIFFAIALTIITFGISDFTSR